MVQHQGHSLGSGVEMIEKRESVCVCAHQGQKLNSVCSVSVQAAGRRTCCISSRGFCEHAREARLPLDPPPPRYEIHSWCSCDVWPLAGSCPGAWSRTAGRSGSPRRCGPRGTPPEYVKGG